MTTTFPGEFVHLISVKYFLVDEEWRPECSCGWTGSYWHSPLDASREGTKHVEPTQNSARVDMV